jgi:hypothetical protein
MLHVTNGDSVSIPDTGLGGEVLVWGDTLHGGPVPPGSDATFARHDEIVLWFEHDLYDQMQLIQILDRLRGAGNVSLISVDRYLGPMTAAQLRELWPLRRPPSDAAFRLAANAWAAFQSSDPTAIERVLARDTSALPYLQGALRRHLEQFPSVASGLARTERQVLEIASEGGHRFHTLFPAYQNREERVFMGDTVLREWIHGLAGCRHPLLAMDAGVYRVTAEGRDVLQCRADHVRLNGIDRRLGGVHLSGEEAQWRWDELAGRLRG